MRSGPLTVSWLPLGYRYINQVTVMFIRGPIIGGLSHIPHRDSSPTVIICYRYIIRRRKKIFKEKKTKGLYLIICDLLFGL